VRGIFVIAPSRPQREALARVLKITIRNPIKAFPSVTLDDDEPARSTFPQTLRLARRKDPDPHVILLIPGKTDAAGACVRAVTCHLPRSLTTLAVEFATIIDHRVCQNH